MLIHRKPSSSASAATANAKTEALNTFLNHHQQQQEQRNDEDEKRRQSVLDHSTREEVAESLDYTSTVEGSSSVTYSVSERETASVRSESILSWLGVWGIVAVYLFLSKVMSASAARKEGLNTYFSKLKKAFVSSETEFIIENITSSFAEYAFVPQNRIDLNEIIKSLKAFMMLQQTLNKYEHIRRKVVKPKNTWTNIDKSVVEELAYYSTFAAAAYGWLYALLFTGRLYLGNDAALMKATTVEKDDIIMTNWQAKTYQPVFYVVKDREKNAIVLSVRGVFSLADAFTCFTFLISKSVMFQRLASCNSKPQLNVTHVEGHGGIVVSAIYISEMTFDTIADELKSNPTYSLVIVGHSMGGGVAAVLGSMWKQRFKNRVKSITYGVPRVFPVVDDDCTYDNVVSLIHKDDLHATTGGFSSFIATRNAVLELCQDTSFRAEIMRRTSLMMKQKNISKEDYAWCGKARFSLQQSKQTKLEVVPGRVHLLSNDGYYLSICHPTEFKQWDLQLHPKSLDVSTHMLGHYQANLHRILSSHETK